MLERVLLKNCSPAMAGIKPSNLVSCYKNEILNAKDQIDELNERLNKKDIYIDVICECQNRLLLIVYRKRNLIDQLKRPEISEFLEKYGYDTNGTLNDYLDVLRSHLNGPDFPHEIGAFLGYPIKDIYGFINGKKCLYIGAWKVYDDVEGAQRTFCRYKICTQVAKQRVAMGQSLEQVFCA